MADKDKMNGVDPDTDGLDLSADPEFLALAADFDAAIKRDAHKDEPAAPDFVLVPDADEPEEEAVPEPEPESEPEIEPEPEAEPEPEGELEPELESEPEVEPEKRGLLGRVGRKKQPKEKGEPAPKASRSSYLSVSSSVSPTVLSRLYDSFALGGLFILTAIFLLQLVPGLQSSRLLWFSDELRQADVLAGVFNGNWLQIYLNGELYQEAPPLYFWFLMGLHKLLALGGLDFGTDYARLLYTGAAISGLLMLWATMGLARSTAHLDRRGAFAAGCVFLSVLFLQFFFHYSSLDLFFAAFIIASHIFMFKALMQPRAPLTMGLAFLCAAVALMSKGALGLALPVLSAIVFCLWRGKPGRLFKGDFLLGLVLALVPALIWLGAIWAGGQHEVVIEMLRQQVWEKAFGGSGHKEFWWYYLAVLPALWLPWSFTALVLPWHKLFSRSFLDAIKSARNGERQGLAFIWIFFLSSFCLISLIQHKQPVYVLPLMGPLAVLTGRAVLQLSPLRSMILQRLMAALFFLLAVAFVLLPVYYSGNIPSFFSFLENITLPQWQIKINGIFLLAVIMLGTTCLLIGLVKARRPESTFLVLLLSATLFSYPISTMTMPSLDKVVSSQSASIEIQRYAGLGYYPVSFKVYPGVFSYYSGIVLNETDDWAELERMVAAQPKIIVAMSATRWEAWTQNPGFTEVMRFWMLSNEYVLLLRNTTPDVFEEIKEEPDSFGPMFEMPLDEELGLPQEKPVTEETAPEEVLEKPDEAPGKEAEESPVDLPAGAPSGVPAPDGMPLTDAPVPQDPFAPVPAE